MRNGRIYLLVSVSSYERQLDDVATFKHVASNEYCSPVAVVLDSPERHNLVVFEQLGVEEADAEALARGGAIAQRFAARGVDTEVASAIISEPHCTAIRKELKAAIAQSSHLRHDFASQTFSNLRHHFRRLGVARKSEAPVTQAMEYLIEEVAIKLSLLDRELTAGEFLPKPEMPLVDRLLAGKYGGRFRLRRRYVRHGCTASGLSREVVEPITLA